MAEITAEDEERFQGCIAQMKNRIKDSDVIGALIFAKKALEIRDSEKLWRRIKKMEDYISATQDESAEEGDDMLDLGDGFFLAKELGEKLYSYQREGVRWLYNLFKKGKGCILGDDMGLGKTLQIISLLAGLLDLQKIKTAVIVMPLTLIANWQAEFSKWTPGIEVEIFHDLTKRQRERACENVQRRGGIILITYGMIMNNWELLSTYRGRQFVWDYVILDEGHKIKNANKTTKAVHQVPAINRVILTGTPIQNNLLELWSLYDFVHSGTLLGTVTTFKTQFSNPILKSREKCATKEEKRLGERMSEVLRQRIQPFFLRRTKGDVLGQQVGDSKATGQIPQALMSKNDFVAWISLTEKQVKIYKECLQLDMITEVLQTKKSPLVQITILKKICDHPRLLSAKLSEGLGLIDDMDNYFDGDKMVATQMLHRLSDEQLMAESGKLKFLIDLLGKLREEGHKCLVFSQSRVMLDIIERILKNLKFKCARIDGTVNLPSERQERIRRFENDSSYSVFLLTTQVGGVGLTLTSADRVVMYDPSWNPAQDSQAVDRVYRIGQKRSVVVYRLITCGTVEERIYRRQVFKQSIHKQTVEKSEENICRYFSRQELRDMFTLEDPTSSKTQIQLETMHSASRKTTTELDSHIAFLYTIEGFFGISDHDLLFTISAPDNEVLDDVGQKHVGDWMVRANKLVDMECEMTDKAQAEQGGFLKPVLIENLPRVVSSRHITRVPSSVFTSGSPDRPILVDEIDELVQKVEILSPFKPQGYGTSQISQSFVEHVARSELDIEMDDDAIICVPAEVPSLSENSTKTMSGIIDLVTPNITSKVNEESLSKTLYTENCDKPSASREQIASAVSEDESEHLFCGSILVPDSESEEDSPLKPVQRNNYSVVDESMNLSAIGQLTTLERPTKRGPMNSTRISSIAPYREASSEDEDCDNPMDERYCTVKSNNGHFSNNRHSFPQSPSPSQQSDKAKAEEWSAIVPPAAPSPTKDRVKASKLRRTSMFVRVANEVVEDDLYYGSEPEKESEYEQLSRSIEMSAVSDDLVIQSGDLSSRSDDLSARSDDLSARSDDLSARSDDLSARSDDLSARSTRSNNLSIRKLDSTTSETDSPPVVTKSGAKKYRRIIIASDTDSD